MKKETFVSIMKSVLNQLEKEQNMSESISVCFSEPVFLNISGNLVNDIIKSLSDEFDDEPDNDLYTMIDWWLWDSPDAANKLNKEYAWVEYNGKRFTLYDIGELYDFLKYKMNNR